MGLLVIDSPYIDIAGYQIYWYGLIVAGGIILAVRVVERVLGPEDDRFWLANLVVGLVGARGYHVLSSWDYYSQHLLEIFNFRSGGLGVYGAVVGVGLTCYCYARLFRISFGRLSDKLALGATIAQSIGRWGNFVNREAFGTPTQLPWGIFIPIEKRPENFFSDNFFHPLFLYESVLNFLLFLLLLRLSSYRNRPDGLLVAIYLIGYGISRFTLEQMRVFTWVVSGVNMAQLVSVTLVVCGVFLLHSVVKK